MKSATRPIRGHFTLVEPEPEVRPRYLVPRPDSDTWYTIDEKASPKDIRALMLLALEQMGYTLRPFPAPLRGDRAGDSALRWLLDHGLAQGVWRLPTLTHKKGVEVARRLARDPSLEPEQALRELEREVSPERIEPAP